MHRLIMLLCLLPGLALAASQPATTGNSCVQLDTSDGGIVLQLFPEKAPVSVKNFLHYVNEGFYDGTIFHRVIANFMVQGGGFDTHGMQKKADAPPIENESNNGLKNKRGTLAMARTSKPDSATSQFFINTADNTSLDYRANGPKGNGYAVFGKVVKGMATVDKMGNAATHVASLGGYAARNVPVEKIVIKQARTTTCPAAKTP